jgi:hypothetical protein
MYVWRNTEGRSCNHCCCGKAICVIYIVCVCVCARARVRARILALVIRHSNPISFAPHFTVICGMSGFILFLHIISNGTICARRLLNIKCVSRFSLQLLSKTFLILRVIQRDMIVNVQYIGAYLKYLKFLSGVNGSWICMTDLRKSPQI